MDAIFGPIAAELLKLGLPGIVIIGLSIAYWLKDKAFSQSQVDRVTDAKACWIALTENTEATKAHTKALEMLTDVVRAGR